MAVLLKGKFDLWLVGERFFLKLKFADLFSLCVIFELDTLQAFAELSCNCEHVCTFILTCVNQYTCIALPNLYRRWRFGLQHYLTRQMGGKKKSCLKIQVKCQNYVN